MGKRLFWQTASTIMIAGHSGWKAQMYTTRRRGSFVGLVSSEITCKSVTSHLADTSIQRIVAIRPADERRKAIACLQGYFPQYKTQVIQSLTELV